jgi:hypothetical protein
MAQELGCTEAAISKALSRWGWGRKTNAQVVKSVEGQLQSAVNKKLQEKMFEEINVHATTAQGMIDELGTFISDNVAIKNQIKKKINEAKISKNINEDIDRLYEAQDKVVQRMEDYRNLQKDLTGIVEVQKFINGVVAAYKVLPREYRIIFNDELKKRNIINLSIEQLVESGDDTSGNGNIPKAEEPGGNAVPAPTGQDQAVLEGTRLLEGQKSATN